MRPAWFPDWSGEVAAIVAGGESVTQESVDLLQDRCRVAVVNNSYELAPWADLLYAVDDRWWDAHPRAHEFKGLKVCRNGNAAMCHKLHSVELVDIGDPAKDVFAVNTPGLLARGGNSGFQATNLVIQFGARHILWLGFDCRGDHWHGRHQLPLRNPMPQRLETWARTFDAQADRLKMLGVEIINCSEISAITAYPKMSVAAALNSWGCRAGRDAT